MTRKGHVIVSPFRLLNWIASRISDRSSAKKDDGPLTEERLFM